MTQPNKQPYHPGLRGQLMIFLCTVTVVTLGAVWLLLQVGLQPSYNLYLNQQLSNKLEKVADAIDQAVAQGVTISSRRGGELWINEEFFQQLSELCGDELASACLDIGDRSYHNVAYSESLRTCLLHEFTGSTIFGETVTTIRADTSAMIALRQTVFRKSAFSGVLNDEREDYKQMAVGRTAGGGQYTVVVSASLAQVESAAVVLGRLLPFVAMLLVVMDVLAGLVYMSWVTKPIRALSGAAKQMAGGNYNVHLEVSAQNELGELAQDFNDMAAQVQLSDQLQRDLLANVSHDLRTPLTLIKGYAETVRDLTGENAKKRTDQMNIIIDESDRLTGLVNSVMELSKVQSGSEKVNRTAFDMAQLCEEVAERYEGVCAQNGWQLKTELAAPLPVYADPQMMERVLHNLLGNAMHHIGSDGVFILRAQPTATGVRVEIEDHGQGIRQEEIPLIFDRYYRSRSDSGKSGTGLGLSITKAILVQHGFRYGVSSAVGKGSTFWFVAERAPAPLPARQNP